VAVNNLVRKGSSLSEEQVPNELWTQLKNPITGIIRFAVSGSQTLKLILFPIYIFNANRAETSEINRTKNRKLWLGGLWFSLRFFLLAGVSRIIKGKVKPFLAEKRHFLPARVPRKRDELKAEVKHRLISFRPGLKTMKITRHSGERREIRNKFPVSCALLYQHQRLG